MVFSEVDNDGNEHWEGFFLVGLQDVQEVIVFEEAHGSISNLQMDATNALDNSFEKLGNEMFNFVHLTDFEDLLKFSQE